MWLGVAGARVGELVEEPVTWPRMKVHPASRTMAVAARKRRTVIPKGRVWTEGVVRDVVVMADSFLFFERDRTPADVSRRMRLYAMGVIG
jgi:hypothetical protein